jgi:CyaY protein
MTSASEETYRKLASTTLKELVSQLDALSLRLGETFEVELANDILTLEFPDGVRFVINSHRAAQQIWMAANTSAWHFNPAADGRWVCSKSGETLTTVLTSQLQSKLGDTIQLS